MVEKIQKMKPNMKETPDFKRIYTDLLDKKFPDKKSKCQKILSKTTLSTLDIIRLNENIFGQKDKETLVFNQQHRSYCEQSIIEILEYQKKNNYNNTQIALKFKLSRNSVAKWKKKYLQIEL
ncbi:helix-turn-helix domain-containing protein [Chryseobacterium soli]|uniref:helix-turn-helix domain-containing protein n=1 Tax=Chryseobacterium soli TaxID=445961 RepID=UPI00295448BE|nr:helix-turn-helix domain-containing protein [Chryseobacterium soli]MDV7695543.1 helix-turn-helix domain-containing protein [Chryseobacterium soli]